MRRLKSVASEPQTLPFTDNIFFNILPKDKNVELSSQIKSTKTAHTYLKQELDDYKLKATKTLQTKDRLISQLKENAASIQSGDVNGSESGSTMNNIKSIEIEELKSERDYLKDELNTKNVALELLRNEMMVKKILI